MKKNLPVFIAITFICFSVNAQWSGDPAVADTKVCTATNDQRYSQIIADGSGGAIIVWESNNGANNSISYNRLNNNGVAVWSPVTTGLQLSTGSGNNYLDQVISDGAGGAFVAWEDDETGYIIKVQHISSTGTLLWTAGGIALSSNGYSGYMCSDNNGGIIVAWQDDQYDPVNFLPRTFAQRINAAGTALWAAGGVRLLNTTAFDAAFGLVPDGSGGAIVALADTRNSNYDQVTGESDNIDMYAQHISAAGTILWALTGVAICTQTSNQNSYSDGQHNYIVADGAGGAIIAWEDYRNDPNNGIASPYNEEVYAQKINANGVVQWTANGVAVCTAANSQTEATLIADGANGAMLTWKDERTNFRIYSQRLNGSGAPQWTANGKVVASLPNDFNYTACADASGSSMLVAWADPLNTPQDILSQKISVADGSLLWGSGTLVCGRADAQTQPAITHNGSAGAIISWTDSRNASSDIYANRVLANGTLPVTLINFEATLQLNYVSLKWKTAIEINSNNFKVQRSLDGINFETIATVKAAGNSNSMRNYSFDDLQSISLKGKVVFFRIVENDIDGKSFYTDVKKVKIPDGKNKFSLLYNPVRNEAILNYECDQKDEVSIKVADHLGRVVMMKQLQVVAGTNKIKLPTANLAKGMYEIELISNKDHEALRMMKQ